MNINNFYLEIFLLIFWQMCNLLSRDFTTRAVFTTDGEKLLPKWESNLRSLIGNEQKKNTQLYPREVHTDKNLPSSCKKCQMLQAIQKNKNTTEWFLLFGTCSRSHSPESIFPSLFSQG